MIDIEKFIETYPEAKFRELRESSRLGLAALLGFINSDEHADDPRHIAYMLATTFHETAGTWQPIEEYGKGKGRKYELPDPVTGKVYFGRGYVQLTWAGNYRTIGKILEIDLYNHPELALVPENAYWIMAYGMRHGTFTGARLSQYLNEEKTDYVGARRIINGTDKADLIAGYAVKISDILSKSLKEVS